MVKPSSDELASLSLRDPLSFGILYINLLQNIEWDLSVRQWSKEIYAAGNPWLIEKYPTGVARKVVVTKSTQAGITTTAMTKLFHFAVNWPVRLAYTLPRQQDVLDMVGTRIDPTVEASPYLKSKLGQPNSTHAKRLGDSYIYFMEMSVESRMLPIDCLYVDEVDLSNSDNLATVVNRLDASRWKMAMYLSTPTVPNYGIHSQYSASDMREWLVKCPSCGYEQNIDWDQNLRIEGSQSKPTKVFYGCAKCNSELTVQHIQTGRWVARHPDVSSESVGFHVHQMLTTPGPILYGLFRDPQTSLTEFYRKRLGKPYEIGGGSLERDDFLVACFDEPYDFEPGWDGTSSYYLGADQGNEIQVLIAKLPPHSRRPKIVHVELIPIERGFDRLAQLIDLYHVRRAVVDANPNRHDAISLSKRFPGRVLVADYVEMKEVWKTRKLGSSNYKNAVSIDRTSGMDGVMRSIKDGAWALPGTPPALHPDIELLIDHVTALKRDVEARRSASGEVQVAVYRKLRADHLAHAWLYLKTAKEIDKGRGMKMVVIGAQPKETDEGETETEEIKLDMDTLTHIVSLLAEVPDEQLAEFVIHHEEADYVVPFPLSYKLGRAREAHEDEAIIRTIILMLSGKKIRK